MQHKVEADSGRSRGTMGRGARSRLARASAVGLAAALSAALIATLAADRALGWQGLRGHAQVPATLPVAVFGSDERVPLPPKYKDVREKIGLLFNTRRPTVCTAFCVAKDVVATASHCLYGTAAGEAEARLGDFMFARNYDAVREYTRIAGHDNGTVGQHVLVGAARLSVRPPIDAARDWALVRLAKPACAKGVLPLKSLRMDEILAEAARQRVFQIAYHRDFTPWKPAYSKPCGVAKTFETADWNQITLDFVEAQALILHTCDTGGASSGSPILREGDNGPEVIGINVGTYVQSKVLMRQGKVKERLKADTVANTGVASSAFAARLEAFERGGVLASRADMRDLQGRLKQRAYFSGRLDGTYGAVLKTAIEAFEKAEGLDITGLATADLLKRLGGGAATVERGREPKGRLRRTGS